MLKVQKNLQNYLILNKFLSSLFGLTNIEDFQNILKSTQEGLNPNSKFFFTEVLQALEISKDLSQDLNLYDENIQEYLQYINQKRDPPIQLKYFQYIAVLFTEIHLDNLFNNFNSFYSDFAKFVYECNNKEKKTGKNAYPYPDKDFMRKLAYWAATGSGKTIIMHVNMLQIQKYFKGDFDNFLLITPNEGLSLQHIKELNLSNIKNKIFEPRITIEKWLGENPIKVIEIHKIKKEVTSQDGKTIPVEAFGKKNIIFVDEGHKGHSTDAQVWKNLRKELVGKKGFTFEYSATFGEITAKDDTFNDYASSIIFDYRYRYFYEDGFGKDYEILNLKNPVDYGDEYFTIALLSFYEQIIYYQDNKDDVKNFNLENPLMIFVGTYVSGKKSDSDVLFIVRFFARFIKEREFFTNIIKDIIAGKCSLYDSEDQSIIRFKFSYLRDYIQLKGYDEKQIYTNVNKALFYVQATSKLKFIEIKNADGEIGLKFNSKYFGVINIGDTSSFLKLIKKESDHFIIGPKSHFEKSLFYQIEDKDSNINFLIGSKKFMEGWNSFRVSSMGLLNIGKTQGTQIIQLFGRGIRLKGFNNSLKRSYILKIENLIPEEITIPNHLNILEALNIFGLNADYMTTFRDNLQDNDVEEYEKIILKIKPTIPDTALYVPRIRKKPIAFYKDVQIIALDQKIPKILIDLSSKVEKLESKLEVLGLISDMPFEENLLQEEVIDLLNFDRIYLDLLKYKEIKNYQNIYFTKYNLINRLKSNSYAFFCKKDLLTLNKNEELSKIEKIEQYVIQLLKTIIDKSYRYEKFHWQIKNLDYITISQDDEIFIPKEYVFIINSSPQILTFKITEFTNKLKKLIRDNSELDEKIYEKNQNFKYNEYIIEFFALNIHLFKPLIYKSKSKLNFIRISPENLVKSERDFILLLEDFLENHNHEFEFDEIYLLRNPSRKGVGFFETKGFYPDFILWIVKKDQQIINFIDPKGLIFIDKNDEKLKLYEDIKNIESTLNQSTGLNIILNSFILSITEFTQLFKNWGVPKEELEQQNILFLEDGIDCIKQLFVKSI